MHPSSVDFPAPFGPIRHVNTASGPWMAADHRVPEDVEVLERPRRLEDRAETRLRSAVSRPVRDLPPLDRDGARVDPEETGDASEQRRLPGAVRADQARQRPALDGQRDVVDRRDGAERLRDAADLAGEVRGAVSVLGRRVYCLNAVPNTATGLHEAIRPAHMLAIWIPLWLRGPK